MRENEIFRMLSHMISTHFVPAGSHYMLLPGWQCQGNCIWISAAHLSIQWCRFILTVFFRCFHLDSLLCMYEWISVFPFQLTSLLFPLVFWHFWFGDRKGTRLVKSWVLVCWWQWFDWSVAYLMDPVVTTTSIILSFNKTG